MKIYIFAVLLLMTGSISPLINKLQDAPIPGTVTGTDSLPFLHPLFQTACKFIGESLWLIISLDSQRNSAKVQVSMLRPAFADLIATVLENLAIAYTFPSHIGMLSSFQVLTTATFSMIVLQRKLSSEKWTALGLIVTGSAMMVLHTSVATEHAPNPLLGDMFMLLAQVFRPLQYIYEEKTLALAHANVMQCAGWEGVWGLLLCITVMPLFYLLPAPGLGAQHLDDISMSLWLLSRSRLLQMTTVCFMLNVALYNFCGLTITQKSSATVRAVINSLRTITMWGLSLFLGWETFQLTSLMGFILIGSGSYLFHATPDKPPVSEDSETESLLTDKEVKNV